MMYDYIKNSGKDFVIVATKYDKIKRSMRDKQLKLIRETLHTSKDQKIIVHSSIDKTGRDELLDLMESQFLGQSSSTSI